MGYYSDVTVVTKKATYEDFMAEYAKAFNGEYPGYDGAECICESDYIRIDWFSVKWYHGMEDVDFINDYFTSLPEDEYYEMMEIGEDYDDVQYRCSIPSNEYPRLYCQRTAEICDYGL